MEKQVTTIREIAKLAEVSPTTVSHVINETRFVSPIVRERVLQAMHSLQYRPNFLARSLRRGETHTIGLILPDSGNLFFAEIGHSIETVAFEKGYSVILCNSENSAEKERIYTEVLENRQVDGIIFVAAGDKNEAIARIAQNGLPVVVIDRKLLADGFDTVLTDNFQGGKLATEHLIGLGHRQIACITGPSNVTPSSERVTGYEYALSQAQIPLDAGLIIRGDFKTNSGYEAAMQLFHRPQRPSAIFVCNDLMAIGALRAAAQCALRVPEDVSIIGFDDIELASYTTPTLTTIAQPKNKIGELAVQLLLERLQARLQAKENSLSARECILPTELVLRESTGRYTQ